MVLDPPQRWHEDERGQGTECGPAAATAEILRDGYPVRSVTTWKATGDHRQLGLIVSLLLSADSSRGDLLQ